jgi:RNA polymerase sigma factor (sigma-70 family)
MTNEELWQQWKDSGNHELRNELITRNAGLVYQIIMKQRRYITGQGVSVDDVIQEVFLAMPRFLKKYNPTRGCKLTTYIGRCVFLYSIKCVRKDQLVNIPLNANKEVRDRGRFVDSLSANYDKTDYNSNSALDALIKLEEVDQLWQAIAKLPERLQSVLHYTMSGNTQIAIGKRWGISRERVRQLYVRALEMLKVLLDDGC